MSKHDSRIGLLEREQEIIRIINVLLDNELEFIVVGGYAVSTYKKRFSIDLDVVIAENELKKIKKISKDLLKKLIPARVVLEWKKKRQAMAGVQLTIQDELENLPEKYTPAEKREKQLIVFQHIYDHYSDSKNNVYHPQLKTPQIRWLQKNANVDTQEQKI